MPNTKSAAKRARQSLKRYLRNRAQRSKMKTLIKKVLRASSRAEAEALYREAQAVIDRLATKGLIHKNKAARKKTQLAHHIARLPA
ncbi:MAG: 30S ribosomal protein S20 [Bacteroidetes bacterium]|nr:30S ribosomal protein S20 [Rhodothermia bacterium]MCS7155290.1 30S ribosomal protein S20 [Bacteroidota bacterium]MCX7907875.1 30S ribosomal protein S20 [Bacteroidota bacterium]MDW8138694.1 30S ribosomal protein S20 [Bacteroidota bacterium]MDW8284720.1 30S ribosomal protein S20 [Bacteroidota bacterium]